MSTNDWYTDSSVIDTLRYYCGLGFFQVCQHYPDTELVQQIISTYQLTDDYEEEQLEKIFTEGADFTIVKLDKNRVIDCAADILYAELEPEYDFEGFVETFKQLEHISRDMFLPQNIQESGAKRISFDLNDQKFEITPSGPPDDPLVLACDLNQIISQTKYRFEQLDLYPDVYLMLLSEEEKQKLIADKGWTFYDDYWMHDDD